MKPNVKYIPPFILLRAFILGTKFQTLAHQLLDEMKWTIKFRVKSCEASTGQRLSLETKIT